MKHALYIISAPPGGGKSRFVNTLMHHFDKMTVVEIELRNYNTVVNEYATFKDQYKDFNAILCVTVQRKIPTSFIYSLMHMFRGIYRQSFSYIELP